MTNAAGRLLAIAILAVLVAAAVAFASLVLYGATQTGVDPINAPTVYRPPG